MSIGWNAFKDLSKLTEVHFKNPTGLILIYNDVFPNSLKKITFLAGTTCETLRKNFLDGSDPYTFPSGVQLLADGTEIECSYEYKPTADGSKHQKVCKVCGTANPNSDKATWKINGLDVIDPQTVDLRVSTASRQIPESVMDELGSEKKPIQLRLYHSGDFGFKTTLSLTVGRNYNDKYATLYYYNLKTKQPEFVGQCLVSGGKAEFEMTHASYYAVTFSSVPLYEDVSAAAGVSANAMPIETAAPVTDGVGLPAVRLPYVPSFSNKKRRYRILRKRRLDDMVFVY